MSRFEVIDPGRLPSGVPAASPRSRVLRWVVCAAFAVASVAFILLLSRPLARISGTTAARITPGMTVGQAAAIIGAPPGCYDGVVMMSTNQPPTKRDWHEWIGSRGCIILYPDATGRVAKASFYPALHVEQSVWQLLLERLTRSP